MLIENILPPALEDDETCVFNKMKAPITLKLAPVGRWYQAYALRQLHKHSLSHASLSSSGSDDSSDCIDSEEEEEDHNIYDPKNWKDQDHYSILGLTKLRHLATFNQIKKAYKRKVLVHHPDKRRARGLEPKEGEEDFFTCVTRAWETLGSATKRRSYDSIDPNFDDSIPSVNSDSKKNFYKVFTEVFIRNSRFSTAYGTATKVPDLGTDDTPFDDVNKFYNFWYEFETWREFSYLDEEEKDKGENRDERRWIEKQNKASRQKKKREESSRMRSLVDNSYTCDPRILRHREEEKASKAAVKQAKRDILRAKQDEQERIEREAEEEIKRKEKELVDASKQQAEKIKREKEALKKQMKKQRKSLRSVAKDFDYFSDCRDQQLNYMQDVERLAETLTLLSLQELNKELKTDDREVARLAFVKSMSTLLSEEENERRELLEKAAKAARVKNESCSTLRKNVVWLPAEVDSLIKAVNLFPAGTTNRWETVAVYIEQHVTGSVRSAKEVLFKAKDLQKNDSTLKETANKEAFDKFESSQATKPVPETVEDNDISARYDSIAVLQIAETGTNPAPWTSDEQKILEQALKTYPSNLGKERWTSIAAVLPNRSKRDCMNRYKELVEIIREKKAAQLAVANKNRNKAS